MVTEVHRCRYCQSEITTKACTQCSRVLPLSAFSRYQGWRTKTEIYRSHCKECTAGNARIRRGDDALREYTEKEVGVYRGGTWRPRREAAA